jgi:replicative DNA helicase
MLDLSPINQQERSNILICDDILKPSQVSSVATLIPDDLHFIGVDFAELMLAGGSDRTESAMAEVYSTLVYTAKTLNVPIVLLSQLSRSYQGGLPQITHLRYTGMAEALASLILLLYNPFAIFASQDSQGALPKQRGKGYVIVGKTRYGHNSMNQVTSGRFAIQLDWDGKGGWGDLPPKEVHPL